MLATAERLQLIWSNPNHLGAFAAIILAWILALGSVARGRPKVLCFTLVLVVWVLISLSASRSAMVSVGCVFVVLGVQSGGPLGKLVNFKNVCMLVVLLLPFVCLVDYRRWYDVLMLQDSSSAARFSLWKGAILMIGDSPFFGGWGKGASGRMYMDFYQSTSDSRSYAGPSNTFLHVGVEFGLGALIVCVYIFVFVLYNGVRTRAFSMTGLSGGIARGAYLSVVVFVVVSLFNTIWVVCSVFALSFVSMCICFIFALREWRRCCFYIPTILTALLFVGYYSLFLVLKDSDLMFKIRKLENGAIEVMPRQWNGHTVDVIVDPALTDFRIVRIVRQALLKEGERHFGFVFWFSEPDSNLLGNRIVATGRCYRSIDRNLKSVKIGLLLPKYDGIPMLRLSNVTVIDRLGGGMEAEYWESVTATGKALYLREGADNINIFRQVLKQL